MRNAKSTGRRIIPFENRGCWAMLLRCEDALGRKELAAFTAWAEGLAVVFEVPLEDVVVLY
jgi:hypothetical protein